MVRQNNMNYYIYWHLDPRTNLPVYAGKGKGERAFDIYGRNKAHKAWFKELKQLGLKPIILIGNHFETEKEVYEIEKQEIAVLRRFNCNMFNIAPGGYGGLGELSRLSCKKSIVCLNTNQIYNSTVAAVEDLKIPAKRINDVLSGRKKSYKGFRFKYLDEKLNEKPNKIRLKKEYIRKTGTTSINIMCNETGKIYISASEAAREIKVSPSAIRGNIIGKIKRVKGLTFKRI